MKILIACVSSSHTLDGVLRHTINLAAALLQRPEIKEVHLVVGSWQLASVRALLGNLDARCHLHTAKSLASSHARNLWYLNSLPRLALGLQVDLVHLAYPAPVRKGRFPCPVVTTLHDLYPIDAPHNFGYPRVLLNRFILSRCLSTVDAIACVSNSTLMRLRTHNARYAAKSSHIPNCVCAGSPSSSAPDLRLEQQPFLLTVAQHRRNKNLPLTLDAFRRLSPSNPELLLVIVGNEGPETPSLHKLLEDEQLHARVLLLHGISDNHLQWCYQHCKLLLATSSVEGFGLPVAEAMLSGCPIVCSDIAAFRELGDTYCRFVPLGSDAGANFAESAQQLMNLARPVPDPLLHLKSSVVVDQCLRLYRGLLADGRYNPRILALQSQKDAGL